MTKKKSRKKRKRGRHTDTQNTKQPAPATEEAPPKNTREPALSKQGATDQPDIDQPDIDTGQPDATEDTQADAETWPQRLRRWGIQVTILVVMYMLVSSWMTSSLLSLGTPAPGFRLATLKGQQIDLKHYRGKRVILHFWATWCGACKMNMPMMKIVAPGYKKDPVLLTVVADGQRRKAAQAIATQKKLNYPILLGSQHTANAYRVNRFPTTYFLDKKGRIISKDSGVITPFGFWWRSLWLWAAGTFL